MKLKQFIEEFVDTFKVTEPFTRNVDVFVNPTPKEMKELLDKRGEFKFIAVLNPNKFYAFINTYHEVIEEKLKIGKTSFNGYFNKFGGTVKIHSVYFSNGDFELKEYKKFLWLKRFGIKEENLKEEFDKFWGMKPR